MKSITQILAVALLLTATLTTQTNAQNYTSSIRMVETSAFSKLNLDVDAEVILIKSSRNMVTLNGEESYISAIPVESTDSVLSLNYEKEADKKLTRVVIEFTDLEDVYAGGNGLYYFHKIESEGLEIQNPEATVIVSGWVGNIEIVSQNGTNDITKLSADKMYVKLGDQAILKEKRNTVFSALK